MRVETEAASEDEEVRGRWRPNPYSGSLLYSRSYVQISDDINCTNEAEKLLLLLV